MLLGGEQQVALIHRQEMENRRFTLKKSERLTDKRMISALFSGKNSKTQFPFRLLYQETEHNGETPVKVAFAVPKRNFKHAVDRNLIKRRMREAFRLNKHALYEQLENQGVYLNIILIYIGKKELQYQKIEVAVVKLLTWLQGKYEMDEAPIEES